MENKNITFLVEMFFEQCRCAKTLDASELSRQIQTHPVQLGSDHEVERGGF